MARRPARPRRNRLLRLLSAPPNYADDEAGTRLRNTSAESRARQVNVVGITLTGAGSASHSSNDFRIADHPERVQIGQYMRVFED
jgi:hypothetical protein